MQPILGQCPLLPYLPSVGVISTLLVHVWDVRRRRRRQQRLWVLCARCSHETLHECRLVKKKTCISKMCVVLVTWKCTLESAGGRRIGDAQSIQLLFCHSKGHQHWVICLLCWMLDQDNELFIFCRYLCLDSTEPEFKLQCIQRCSEQVEALWSS